MSLIYTNLCGIPPASPDLNVVVSYGVVPNWQTLFYCKIALGGTSTWRWVARGASIHHVKIRVLQICAKPLANLLPSSVS